MWAVKWNPRNRVEGSYGILKNIAVIGYCRSYHHFVGLARETLITVFALIAYNFHMLNQYKARQRISVDPDPDRDSGFDPFSDFPSAQPVAAAPIPVPVAKTVRGPKGLEFLGSSRAGPNAPPV